MSVQSIGGDWVANTDPNTGKTYYANLTTKETTWEWPKDVPKPGEASADAGASDAGAGGAATAAAAGDGGGTGGDWREVTDPGTGRKYYHNRVTGETSWTPPPEFTTASASASDEAGPESVAANWQSKQDQSTMRMYYYNTVTRSTTWEKPACLDKEESSAAESAPAVEAAAANAAPEPPAAGAAASETPPQAGEEADTLIVEEPEPVIMGRGRAETVSSKLAALKQMKIEDENEDQAGAGAAAAAEQSPTGGGAAQRRTTVAVTAPKAGTPMESALSLLERVNDPVPTEDLMELVCGLKYTEYAEKNFNFDRKGIFGSKTTTEKITSWKGKDVIKTSLSILNDKDLQTEAVQCFRNVTGFMGDRSSNKSNLEHCFKLINNMLQSMEDLRNEVFCQIAKQTKNNPSLDSTLAGWQLMVICLGCFPPGALLRDYLMAYCSENITAGSPQVARYAEYALHCIPKIFQLGVRRELPTHVEVEAAKRLAPVTIRVNFLDSKYVMVPVNSWTTAAQLNKLIAMRLGVKTWEPFAIFEVSTRDEERVLEPDERILDLVAYWARLNNEERTKKGKHSEVEEFHFVYKVHLFFDVPEEDAAGVEMTYIQSTHDVVDARYPCSEQDAITLAALQVQEEFGDHPGDPCHYITGKMSRYLAEKYIEASSEPELEHQVLQLYVKLNGYSQQEARLSYLDYVKSWKIYGSSYYFAEPQNNRDFPPEVVLAINAKSILVVDPESKEFLKEYPYSQVLTWGHSQNSFVVVLGPYAKQVKIYFKTDQGKEMNTVVRSYVEHIVGRNTPGAAEGSS
mmetsp:Transcript_24752/g.72588  ORF Transcript_24752/g.72588 Transcript_24752/m.72588 type:complete len:799 (-) Transcript_24752:82-2478(-)|eukprot:CAMPEP_0118967114 /NCGR_PEP_ID=MMETSP1173-20130426/4526_1 /TAXON_ID=1034831 /ORGANISM="Rhizochromulina marina cf, Strain CCMP1243" /LENGTH=798 /DNA_ID=CAMNT_0006916019 /DNA_START=93 /DNA_END=2489 /DNA_ORIENTATION=+